MNLEQLMEWNEEWNKNMGADRSGDRVRSFLRAFVPEEEGESEALWREAREAGVPVIRQEMKELMRVLLLLKRPARILEIGTAVGYSALFMRECLMHSAAPGRKDGGRAAASYTENGKPASDSSDRESGKQAASPERESFRIDTIEKDEERFARAAENFRKAAAGEIHGYCGDAAEVIKKLEGPYDFVFMDAAKAQYGVYLDRLEGKLSDHAVIVTDNILQEGAMVESRYISDKRDRTIHDRMREYLFRINRPPFRTVLLDSGDGAAVTVLCDAALKSGNVFTAVNE